MDENVDNGLKWAVDVRNGPLRAPFVPKGPGPT